MSNHTWVIRSAARHEIPEIECDGAAAYAQYREEAPPAIFEAYDQDLRSLARYWDDAQVLVAEFDRHIAGAVLFYLDASSEGLGLPSGWAGFRKLAVHPSMRGRGLGRKLVETCLALARKRGAEAVGIHTVSFMRAACRIYETMGFQRCPEYDIRASDMLGIADGLGEVLLIAYRCDLATKLQGSIRGDIQMEVLLGASLALSGIVTGIYVSVLIHDRRIADLSATQRGNASDARQNLLRRDAADSPRHVGAYLRQHRFRARVRPAAHPRRRRGDADGDRYRPRRDAAGSTQ